jgi:uncharacterized cupredoxin-like copper-binding protein
MAVYFVLGSILVAWGLGLAIFGLLRPDFPPSGQAGRALVGATVVIVAGTLVALLATTEKEHPREEAAAEAAEQKEKPGETAPAGQTTPESAPPAGGGQTVKVSEKEFSIALAGGDKLEPGNYTFAVDNTGKIQHDLAIRGNGIEETKTPLIDAGQSKDLSVDLKPGKYTFYCTVPGHEQSGMKVAVTVAGGSQPGAQKAPAAPKKTKKAATPANPVAVTEKEFSIALAGGNDLKAGKYEFNVQNQGKIQHDLAIEGNGVKEKQTKLIDGGKAAKLAVSLKPGKYKFYCTVPGHEQAGMKVQVTVK